MNQVSGQFAHYNNQNGTWFTQFPNHHYCSSESFSILCGLSGFRVEGKPWQTYYTNWVFVHFFSHTTVWLQNTRPTASWCSYPDWDRVLNDYKQHDRARLMVWLGFKPASSPYDYLHGSILPVTILCNNLFQKEKWSLPPVGKTVIVHKWCIWVCIISYLWTQIIILRGYTFLTSLL